MNHPPSLLDHLSAEAVWRLDEICHRFEQSWQAGQSPRPEDYIGGSKGAERLAVLRELLRLDVHYRRMAGEGPSARDYTKRFPDAVVVLSAMFPDDADEGSARAEHTVLDTERTGEHLGERQSINGEAAGADSPAGVVPVDRPDCASGYVFG
jgi:hypothetical protein